MPILILLIIIILIAQVGFWDTLQAILGGILMIVLLVALMVALAGIVIRYAYRRMTRGP